MKPKTYTTKEVAKIKGLKSDSRIRQKCIAGKEFPNAYKCECGKTWLIPEKDIRSNPNK